MPANYVLLERIELNASAASVTFSNIPQSGYTDLKVVASSRCTTDNFPNVRVQFNNNTSSYSHRILFGSGSSAGSYSGTNDGIDYNSDDAASQTANTFSNSEIYIPNYTGSTNKSVSVDAVSENNATAAYALLTAGLWANTAAITSIKLYYGGGQSFAQYSTFSLYGLAAVGTTPVIAPKASGGNIIDFDGTYWIHTFTTTGAFVPQTGLSCDYLVIGGGGGSGGEAGAGGGAGGYLTSVGTQGGGGSAGSALSLAASTSYTVTVGAGGAGGTSTGGSGGGLGANGTSSSLSTITALGGGGGSGYPASGVSIDGLAGGSGGGGGNGGSGSVGLGGAASSPTQGYAGGTGAYTFPNGRGMGGGGGAGSVGANGVTATGTGGNGGSGITSSISGTSVARAGGGGGAGQTTQGTGTAGGGTNSAGTVNTGGGGSDNYTFNGGNPGGSGVVIIRYLAS